MKQITKKQHYIWRNYLAPWTSNNSNEGRIACLRNNKIFTTSLINIAHENFFYGVKELSQPERHLIHKIAIEKTQGMQRRINEGWLQLYCSLFDMADRIASFNYLTRGYSNRDEILENQDFKDWNAELVESLHGKIELSGLQYLALLRENKLDFWQKESDREKFSFYIANQYFRTKKIRDGIKNACEICKNQSEAFSEIRPDNIWIPLTLIFASNVGVYISQEFSSILLQAPDDNYFIVGDQPVVNTYSTFDIQTVPEDVEFYYPITPRSALLLTKERKEMNSPILSITPDEVKKYNTLEQKVSNELIFAKDTSHLQEYVLTE